MGLRRENSVIMIYLMLALFCVIKCDFIDSTNDRNHERLYTDDKRIGSDNHKVVDDDVVPRNKRSTGNGLVIIARFKSGGTGKMFPAYVDDTMTRLIFQVAVDRSEPLISVLKPSGSLYTVQPVKNGTASQGTVVATLDIPITSSDYGFWKFKKNDATTWDVTILGESPVSISHELFEIGSTTPVTEYPVVGNQYNIRITVDGMNYIHSSDFGMIMSKDKLFPLKMDKLVPKGHDVFEMSNVTLPAEAIMIGIQGKDNSSHMYKRLDDKEVIPVTCKLFVPPYTGTMIEVRSTFNISFTVTNIMSITQDIDVRIEDDKGLVQIPKVLSVGLAPGENFTGIFQLEAGNNSTTTMVKIHARQYKGGGNFTSGPTEIRHFTIFEKTTVLAMMQTSTTSTPITTASNSYPATIFKQKTTSVTSSMSFMAGPKATASPVPSSTSVITGSKATASTITTQTPMTNSKNISTINLNGGSNQSGVQLNVQGNPQKRQNSLLLMLLSICDSSNININL